MTIPKLYSIGKSSRIVSKESSSVSSLQTFSVIPNAALFSPLERIVITANGNLQRILSAFHNMPISVAVLKSEYRGKNSFDREVYLHLQESSSTENTNHQHILCYINGEILVTDENLLHKVQSGTVGVGQLFAQLRIQPVFTLHSAGKLVFQPANNKDLTIDDLRVCHNELRSQKASKDQVHGNVLWRDYSLHSDVVSCRFVEIFVPDFLEKHQ